MSRLKWKGPFLNFKKIEENNINTNKKEKKIVMSRNSEIVGSFKGFTYSIHNGKNLFELTVNENMVGHKFGEFCFTRAKFIYKKKKKKLRKK